MSITNMYADAARNAQERWMSAMEQMTSEWQRTLPMDAMKVDPVAWSQRAHEGIDRSFEMWMKALQVQREAAYQIADANIALLAAMQGQALEFGQQVGDQMKQAGEQVAQAGRTATDAVAGAAAKVETSAKETTAAATTAANETAAAAADAAKTTNAAAADAAKATNSAAAKTTAAAATAAKPATRPTTNGTTKA